MSEKDSISIIRHAVDDWIKETLLIKDAEKKIETHKKSIEGLKANLKAIRKMNS